MKGSRVGSFKGGSGGGSGGGGVPQPTDLLVCCPTRSHLTLMPKPICSPSRPNTHHHHHRPTSQSSPRALFRTPANRARSQLGSSSDPMSEPTSPKVTCAGQIKVRSSSGGGSSSSKRRTSNKHSNWVESLGLKKDVMNFLGALRSLRFNMQCFGSFHGAVNCCSDEEEEEEEEEEDEAGRSQARTVFSKWFMVLEENNDKGRCGEEEEQEQEEEEEEVVVVAEPPKNALLLMRCRSAPAKGLEAEDEKEEEGEGKKRGGNEERLMLMSYAPDFLKMSMDVAKETWVVGSVDPLARSRSWRR